VQVRAPHLDEGPEELVDLEVIPELPDAANGTAGRRLGWSVRRHDGPDLAERKRRKAKTNAVATVVSVERTRGTERHPGEEPS
jgi:hypothetical protein